MAATEHNKRSKNIKRNSADSFKHRKLLYILLAGLNVFLIASLYTPWVGKLGDILSHELFAIFGSAVIIPLVFSLYLLILKISKVNIIHFIRQTLGVILIYINATVLIGLYKKISYTEIYKKFENPGIIGEKLSDCIYTSLGPIGTLILGLISIYISVLLFNVTVQCSLKLPELKINLPERKKKDKTSNNLPEDKEVIEEDYQDNEETENAEPEFNIDNPDEIDEVTYGIFPPPIEVFGHEETHDGEITKEQAQPIGEKIISTLEEFNIEANLAEILIGPTVIQFRIQLAPGIKVSRVAALSNDIALAMAVPSLRIEAPIPGKPYVGIEIPNPKRRGIPLRTIIESDIYHDTKVALPLPMGIGVNGDSIVAALDELPHLLVAGTTGSGKSVFVNACIVGLCSKRSPQDLRMILVDPKRVEMSMYDKLPHLLTPPVTDAKKAVHVLAWALREMEKRYSIFAGIRVRNLEGYNEKVLPKDKLPHIVIVVDELADLMMTAPKEVEEYICRLAQMARATGIHLMLATQRPSVNVITGLIKANIPARVAFTLPSNADSRTIIDSAGAEKLLGKGDMLFLSTKYPKPIRIQSPWVSDNVLSNWLDYIKNSFDEPVYIEINAPANDSHSDGCVYDDELIEEAISVVMSTGIASASGLQRRLRIGFSRASRILDMLEQLGVVGPAEGSKARDILVDEESALNMLQEAREGE